jgi:excisionase family DNA binding protein
MLKNTENKEYFSTGELARLLNISRISIFKRIRSGKIKAIKVGHNYIIPREEFMSIIGTFISKDRKNEIDAVVRSAVLEYGEALKLLGSE